MNTTADQPAPLQPFGEQLATSLERGDLDKLVLANYRGSEPGLQRVIGRIVVLKGEPHLQLLYRYKTRDVTKNVLTRAGAAEVLALLDRNAGHGFGHVHLRTADAEIDLRISKKGQATLSRHALHANAPATPPDAAAHDRAKRRPLALDAPYWHDLGITDAQGAPVPSMSRKWKQINRFIEVLEAAWRESPLAGRDAAASPVRVFDFGAGKGYLSFAVAAWLDGVVGTTGDIVGVELRADLVDLCNASAQRHRVPGLRFEQGDVMHHGVGEIDIMIALHACDTATDHAIHKGILAGAQIILCSPCCHKELRPQLSSPGLLRPMLQHGIHLGQQAEMITDSLRALLLEAHGYRSQVFEFVSLEHTSKNKMILAVKRAGAAPADQTLAQIRAIKDFYGVREQCLETLLLGAAGTSPAR